MPNRIEIIDGLLANGGANKFVCCEDCGTNVSTFQNTHGSNLNVTAFNIFTTGAGVNVTLIAIDGLPPSFPFLVPDGGTFTMEFEICWDGVTSPLGTWLGQFDTFEHSPDTPLEFTMACVPVTYFTLDPTTINFVDAPVGIPVTQTITSGPGGMLAQTLTLTGTGCENVVVNPSPIIVPQQEGPFSFDVTWTPVTAGETLSCSLEFCSGETISITGNSVAIECDECICCVDVTIKTENGYLPDVSGLCNDENLYSTASFLERKTIVFSLIYPSGINSQWQLQFNPGLFLRLCESPFTVGQLLPTGYSITYLQSLMPDGVAQPMQLNGTGTNSANRKNWECFFRPVNAALGTFQVELTFYQLQDLDNFILSTLWQNLGKFIRNSVSATSSLTNTAPSVYNANKVISGAFMVVDPTILTETNQFTKCQFLTCTNYTARFYNKGLYNLPSEFTGPSFVLSRNVGTVTNLSSLEKTRVEFRITVPSPYGAGEPVVIFHLFDVGTFDNTVDFLASSDSSRFRVLGYGGTGVLDNHLVRPGAVSNVGGEWRFSLHVGTTINPSTTYLMAAIVYDSDGTMVNTFISDVLTVQSQPDFDCDCTLDIDSKWLSYWQQSIGNEFRPVSKERIGHELTINGGTFETCLRNWGYTGDWRDLLQSVTLRVHKRESAFPTATQTTFFEYNNWLSIRNSGYPNNFQNTGALTVADDGSSVITSIMDRRVLYDNIPFVGSVQVANSATYMNRAPAGPLSTAYINTLNVLFSWMNEIVYFEYQFKFNLSSIVGGPFVWNIVKAFPVNAIDFEPTNSGNANYLLNYAIYGRTSLTGSWTELENPVCFKDWAQIKLVFESDREGNFLFFATPIPGYIEENDETFSPNGLTQLSSPMVVTMDTVFDPITFLAEVVLDTNQMTADKYDFCGYISNPEAASVCEYFVKHARYAGSGVSIPAAVQWGPSFQISWAASSYGYLGIYTQLGYQSAPVPGQTYVLEYSFTSATTLILNFWFGQLNSGGAPTLTIPVGSTSGSISFVWPASIFPNGPWYMISQTGTPMTSVGTFKIGNQLCP